LVFYPEDELQKKEWFDSLFGLWNQLLIVKKNVSRSLRKTTFIPMHPFFELILKKIDNLEKQVKKGYENKHIKSNDYDILEKFKSYFYLLDDIINRIKKELARFEPESELGKASMLLLKLHHLSQVAQQTKSLKLASKLNKPRSFTIKQLDKSRADIYLIGEKVSCCVAPTGSFFENIIQIRWDIARPIIGVIDNSSDEIMACSWPIVAYSKDNPKDFFLLINHVEMRFSYALKKSLCDQIVTQVLKFTAQYAADLGVKAVLLKPLDYGPLGDFKGLSSVNIELEKVGGFLKIISDDTETTISYSIPALDKVDFYEYPISQSPSASLSLSLGSR